jgi:lipopolysaccharide export system protein LptC
MRASLTWLIVLGFAVVMVVTDWIQELATPDAKPPVTEARAPDSVLEDYRITLHAEDGQPRYHLAGPRLSHFPDDDSNLLDQPRLTVYASAHDPAWTVDAESGLLAAGADELLLNGPVTLERLPGPDRPPMRIDTSDLRIEPDNDLAETTQPVRITGEDYVVDAVGARARLYDQGSLVELHSQVRGRHDPIDR